MFEKDLFLIIWIKFRIGTIKSMSVILCIKQLPVLYDTQERKHFKEQK